MATRMIIFFFGLCMLSLGISIVTHAELGTGTVSSVAIVMNKATGLSMGLYVFATNAFFFILQIFVDPTKILQKALRQLPICACFGFIFDIAYWLTSGMTADTYIGRLGFVALGVCGTGLGIASMVFARIAILPLEGVVLAVLGRWGGSFGTLRMGVDVIIVTTAIVLSLIFFGTIVGIREGTLITALCSGPISKQFLRLWGKLMPKHRVID